MRLDSPAQCCMPLPLNLCGVRRRHCLIVGPAWLALPLHAWAAPDALVAAAEAGDVAALRRLLDAGAPVASMRSLPPAESRMASQRQDTVPAMSCLNCGSLRKTAIRVNVSPGEEQCTAAVNSENSIACSRLAL